MTDVETSSANGTQTTQINGITDSTEINGSNGSSDASKTTSSNRLSDGQVTGLFAMYKNHKQNKGNNGVVKAPKTVEVPSSTGTTIMIQDTSTKQAITDDKSVNNIFTPPSQASSTPNVSSPSASSDDLPSPGFVSRFQAKKQQMIRWPLKTPSDPNAAMPKVFQTEATESTKSDTLASTSSIATSTTSPSTTSASSTTTAEESAAAPQGNLRSWARRKQQIQNSRATLTTNKTAETQSADASSSTSSPPTAPNKQLLKQELDKALAEQQDMWKKSGFMQQSSTTPATKGQAPSLEATQTTQSDIVNTAPKPARPANGPPVYVYDEDNPEQTEEEEEDVPQEDEKTVVRNTLQSYKDRALELANQKEALLGAALQLQDIIEKAHAENQVLKDQLTEARQQRIGAMNAMTELRQRLRTLDNLLVEQSQEIDGLRWNLHNMTQQLEVSTKEKDQLMLKAKQLESVINESMPSKQILELRTQLEREKILRAKMEQYAKKLESESSMERRNSSSYAFRDTVQLLLLLILCFSLFGFIVYRQTQDTRKAVPPWLSET